MRIDRCIYTNSFPYHCAYMYLYKITEIYTISWDSVYLMWDMWDIFLLLLHYSKQILILILNTQCGMTEEQTVYYSRLMQTITLNYKQSQSHYDPPFLFAEVSYARPT